MTAFDFEVLHYPAGPGLGAPSHISTFQISKKRLVVATVRSILTSRAPWAVRHAMAASVLPSLHYFVSGTHAPAFRVWNIGLAHLRDFSLTSRIGEFAQGIAYAYWAFGVRCHVADFVEWSRARYPYEPLPTRPDYAVVPYGTTDLFVMEAKGTGDHEPRDQMRKALRQAKGIEHHPGVTNAFGTVATFHVAMSLPARIHVKDPEMKGDPSVSDRYDVFRRHYASWFELAGDFARARALREQAAGEPSERVETHFLRDSLLQALGMTDGVFRIDPLVEEALDSQRAYASWQARAMKWSGERLADPGLDFPDGTSIEPASPVTPVKISDGIAER